MRELRDPQELRRLCDARRATGQRVGLVPTMGFLHQGHLSLMKRARELADFVVVSIFVNPTQFGPGEDLDRYPQDLPGDLAKCRAAGVDLVFAPERDALYPDGYQTFVEVGALGRGLCGERRPGHFRGVATVVTKLFNLVGPCVAVFGEKDYQQLQVIRRLARDLELPVEVFGAPTVREPDGLAMSSRNSYLTPAERASATCLQRALEAVRVAVRARGRMAASEALAIARGVIEAEPGARVDYVELRDAETLEPRPSVGAGGMAVEAVPQGRTLLALAVYFGKTRLIDNTVI
jgi:pantoate--beta-alanine ligase